ncbi:RING-H2 finger protein ATL80-like protein [Carex littledalei]|uniref:RING-H2 finger protein ATL80-like protein n=1 Tax=Carex littledalei TaxID=544730 RepID=A0A833VSJ0_9POAL|nr:RING-H2 finger protein ATL80-like protein [Carex littledalei]
MRALLQFATATTSSQFPLPPASSAAVATTTTSNDDVRNNFTADIIVVLAALLCAVICMAGLALINRCNNTLRDSSSNGTASTSLQQQQQDTGIQLPLPPPPKRGLKKSALKALPKTRYDKTTDIEKQTACVICLTEFEEGEEIRKLPQCGHEFHVGCVDKWLRAQSSCPSCRRVLVVVPPPKQGFERGGPRNKAAIGDSTSTFLP